MVELEDFLDWNEVVNLEDFLVDGWLHLLQIELLIVEVGHQFEGFGRAFQGVGGLLVGLRRGQVASGMGDCY